MRGVAPTVLLVSQTVSLPARRRTWQQAQALTQAGWEVRVLCPRGQGQRQRETIDGVQIRRFAQLFEGSSKAGLLAEYVLALTLLIAHLIAARLRGRIDVVQVVNPPDWLVIPALLLRPFGTRIVFDMADFSTYLFEAKFGRRSALMPAVVWLNRLALRIPDLVLSANETYRRIAAVKGRRSPGTTLAVYSYAEHLPPISARVPGPLRIGYFGVLGSQDGVDRLIEAASRLRSAKFELIIVGDGPALPSLREFARQAGLSNARFTGFLSGEAREAAIASFDIAVIADPANRYTHSISMNKAFAYAAHGLAIVSTPLRETKRLLPCALFTRNEDPAALSECLERLLLDESLRKHLGEAARARAKAAFDWHPQSARYVAAMNTLASGIAARIPVVPIA